MTISIQELELQVTMAVLKMATVKEETFWRGFAEVLFALIKHYDDAVSLRIINESHLRLSEFEKSWQVNLYNRRFHK